MRREDQRFVRGAGRFNADTVPRGALAVALVVGYFPAAFLGLSPWLSLALGAGVLVFVLLRYGRKAEAPGTVDAVEDAQDPEAEQAGASAS